MEREKGTTMRMGYIGDTKWHYQYWKEREYLIGWFYKGQLEKRNIVTIRQNATEQNYSYFTNDGKSVPKFVFRALLRELQQNGGNQ